MKPVFSPAQGVLPVVLGLFLANASVAHAQTTTLKETVITASRFEERRLDAPASIQVLTQEDIRQSGALSVPDVLMMLGGVNVRNVSGGQLGLSSAVDLGGFGATATNNTLVLLDGRRINPIDSSDIAWSVVPLDAIERIEIASGAFGVQYGDGASGGVVNIITNRKAVPADQAKFTAGSFGTVMGQVNLAKSVDNTQVQLNGSVARSDGWRENSQAQSQNVSFKVRQALDRGADVFGEVFAADQSNGLAGGVTNPVGQGDQRAVRFNNVGMQNSALNSGLRVGGFAAVSQATTLDLDLVLSRKDSKLLRPYYDTPDALSPFFITGPGQLRASGDVATLSAKFKTEWAQGASLVYGYDVGRNKQDGTSFYGPLAQQVILANQGPYSYQGNLVQDTQSVQLLSHSIYAMARLPLAAAWEMTVGARRQLQSYDTSDTNIMSGTTQTTAGTFAMNAHELALTHKWDAGRRAYLRVNQSYRFANTDEYWGFDAMGNRAFSGELKPQVTQGYELGYEQQQATQQFGIVFGQSVTHDEIRYDPSVYQNANLADNLFRTSLGVNWAQHIGKASRLSASARFQRAEFLSGPYAGQTPGLIPHAIYNLNWLTAFDPRTQAGVQLTHVSSQNYDASPAVMPGLEQMPAYTTVDVFLTRTYQRLETKVMVKNLLGQVNATYGGYGFVQNPGATGGNSYYYYPSDPRAVMISAIYRF